MAFHPRYWLQPVKNSSADYNYYTWNKLYRGEQPTEDRQGCHIAVLPCATEALELDPQFD